MLRSGWLTSGEVAEQLETEFQEWLGLNAIAVSSASAGLQLTYSALRRRGVTQVVVPSLTFTSTAMGAIHSGLDCTVVDIDDETMCLDPKFIRDFNDPKIAVTAVHYGGFASPDLREVLTKISRAGIHVVEDAAHALPARDDSGYVGSSSTSAAIIFSFYANKTVTSGEGGMIVTSDAGLASELRLLRQHGINRDSYFRRFHSSVDSWDYEVLEPGFKANLPDLLAALGVVQFRRRFELQQSRASIARRYIENFQDSDLILPPHTEVLDSHAWHLFVIRVPVGIDRDDVMRYLKSRGIGCSLHYRPLHRHRYYRERYSLDPRQFPVSEAVFATAISLPIFPDLSLSQVDQVSSSVLEALKK